MYIGRIWGKGIVDTSGALSVSNFVCLLCSVDALVTVADNDYCLIVLEW